MPRSRAIKKIRLSEKYKDSILIGTDICDNTYGLYEGIFEKIWRVL